MFIKSFVVIVRIPNVFKTLVVAASLSLATLSASAITVNFSGNIPANQVSENYQNSGSFTGTDNNMDGLLSLNELTAFSAMFPSLSTTVGLANLYAFGSYVIGANTWIPDSGREGVSFFGWTDEATLTDANTNSTAGFIYDTAVVAANAVPEPGSLALLGLGLAGLVVVKRRKSV